MLHRSLRRIPDRCDLSEPGKLKMNLAARGCGSAHADMLMTAAVTRTRLVTGIAMGRGLPAVSPQQPPQSHA